jgi:hypothetical protein
MGAVEEAGKAATGVIEVMKGAPVILALLLVNAAFIGIFTYFLGQISATVGKRDATHLALIEKLVSDIRDCRQGPRSNSYDPTTKSMMFRPMKGTTP